MEPQIKIFPDPTLLCAEALALVLNRLQTAIATRGEATLALAGGTTPKQLYRALAQESLPGSQLQIFWGDERYVPPDHADSNQRLARQAWLDHVDIPPARLHPMPTQSGDPQRDAELYENELARHFHLAAGEFPCFDLILLGLGDDGHTASLFPHTPALQVGDRLITVGNKNGEPRITFTVPLINHARCVIFLVSGANKQMALSQILAPQGDDHSYPARLIRPQGELFWLLDSSAATLLLPLG